jgi:branched-chain amino acid aminotransferase
MASYYHDATYIYHNGNLVKAKDARIDLYSQTMHYGMGVFEGIRSYRQQDGSTAIFKAAEHFQRLRQSAAALHLPYHWTDEELIAATHQVLKRNDLQDAYIRPLVYAPANMSFQPNSCSHIAIMAWEMPPFLGNQLLRVHISDIRRPNPQAFQMHAKAVGHYVNSIMASQQAKSRGFDEALLLDNSGHIAEGPGANFFLQIEGKLVTPPAGNILPGITRATVLELCEAMDIEAEVRPISPSEIAAAESAFFCGTAAEIVGIASIDQHSFSLPWQQTLGARLQQAYKALVQGAPIYHLNEQHEIAATN